MKVLCIDAEERLDDDNAEPSVIRGRVYTVVDVHMYDGRIPCYCIEGLAPDEVCFDADRFIPVQALYYERAIAVPVKPRWVGKLLMKISEKFSA
jgi:hypothetical protein